MLIVFFFPVGCVV